MADTLPSPPPTESRSSSVEPDTHSGSHSSPDTSTLTERLDSLLEQYLDLVDSYTTLRSQLSKSLSSSFFSLAQAQRGSSLGSGRRYGAEYYDERMKAQRLVRVQQDSQTHKAPLLQWHIERRLPPIPARNSASTTKQKEEQTLQTDLDSSTQATTKQSSSENSSNATKASPLSEGEETKNVPPKTKIEPADRDPITWFGILAPSSLRQTQAHFVTLVDTHMPDLINVDSRMCSLEEEIWKVRKELGILAQYEETQAEDNEPEDVPHDRKHEASNPVHVQLDTSSRRKVPGRPAHSKSTLLRLGE